MGDDALPEQVAGYKERRKKLLGMLTEVWAAYPAAVAASVWFIGEASLDYSPHTELLKRYRLFTRYVCEAAQEVWPKIDFREVRRQL